MIIEPYRWYPVAIHRLARASDTSVSAEIIRPAGYRYLSGQYTIVRRRAPDGSILTRQYSFSSPADSTHLELTVQKEPHGALSGWFYDLAQPGDVLEISQPFGAFTWEPSVTRPLLLVAGGSGIAPCMGIVRHHASTQATSPLALFYSVREASHACFQDELARLTAPRSAVIVTTKDSPRLSAEHLRTHATADALVYICGAKPFIRAMDAVLLALDIPAAHIRHEAFTLA